MRERTSPKKAEPKKTFGDRARKLALASLLLASDQMDSHVKPHAPAVAHSGEHSHASHQSGNAEGSDTDNLRALAQVIKKFETGDVATTPEADEPEPIVLGEHIPTTDTLRDIVASSPWVRKGITVDAVKNDAYQYFRMEQLATYEFEPSDSGDTLDASLPGTNYSVHFTVTQDEHGTSYVAATDSLGRTLLDSRYSVAVNDPDNLNSYIAATLSSYTPLNAAETRLGEPTEEQVSAALDAAYPQDAAVAKAPEEASDDSATVGDTGDDSGDNEGSDDTGSTE